jgi:hypothetical protein
MPEIGRIDLRYQTVGSKFAHIKEALLPVEIAESSLAHWVMNYDELIKKQTDREVYRDKRQGSEGLTREMIGYFTADILQSRIPFYFASLFHIGRQWKVVEAALGDCSLLLQDANLSRSAQNLVELLRGSERNNEISSRANFQQVLQQLCDVGAQSHRANLEMAKKWWQSWQIEVGDYRKIVDSIHQSAPTGESRDRENNRWIQPLMQLMMLASKPSVLQSAMLKDGVKFKVETNIIHQTSVQFFSPFLTFMGLMALTSSEYERRYFDSDDFRRTAYMMEEYLREVRTLPDVEYTLSKLRAKYGDTNPFEQYKAGQKAPTIELLQLINENELPNRHMTTWYHTWINTLDDEPYTWDKFPKTNKPLSVILEWAMLSADSTIKRNLTDRRQPAESWGEFIQRLFEEEWVKDIGYMMGEANKSSSSSSLKWDSGEFIELISKVVEGLNKTGYSLVSPASSRLITLLDKASKGESVSGNDAW